MFEIGGQKRKAARSGPYGNDGSRHVLRLGMIRPYPTPSGISNVKQPKPHAPPWHFGLRTSDFGLHRLLPSRRLPSTWPGDRRAPVSLQWQQARQTTVIHLDAPVIGQRCASCLKSPLDFHVHLFPMLRHKCLQRRHGERRRFFRAAHRDHRAPGIHWDGVSIRATIGAHFRGSRLLNRMRIPPRMGAVVLAVETGNHQLTRRGDMLRLSGPRKHQAPHRPHFFPEQAAKHLLDCGGVPIRRLVERQVGMLHEQDPRLGGILLRPAIGPVEVGAGCNIRCLAGQLVHIRWRRPSRGCSRTHHSRQ